MKHVYLLLLTLFVFQDALRGQEVYDFETEGSSLFFQYFGSSLEPMLTTVIDNPDASGINTSAKVGKYIKAAGAQVWAGGFANPAPVEPFDATNGGQVCIKVWMDHVGNVALKLEQPVGGGENWLTTREYTTPNQWAELCFDLTEPSLEDSKLPAAGKSFGMIVLFFDFQKDGGAEDVTYYFDDITKPKVAEVITTILDFETPETSRGFTYFGSPLDGQSTIVVTNPLIGGINVSDSVSSYTKPAVAEVWAGAYSNPNPAIPVEFIPGNKVCIKVLMNHVGNLALKLEASTSGKPNWIQKVDVTTPNEWVEICFDPTVPSLEAPFEAANSLYERVVLFFDFGTGGTGEDVISYFDDLVVKSGGAPPIRTVNFRVNMNNFTSSFDQVFLSGSFNDWSGDANPLQDDDEDGIWEGTLMLKNGAYEYKITLDNWVKQENFLGTEECTKTTDAFTNRLLLISGDTDVPEFCYNSCYACGEQVNIQFRLGMGAVIPNPEGVWLAGGGNFEVPGGRYKMKDDDGDGVYEIMVPRKQGFSSFFTFTNGPCADYSCKENIEGLSCANPNNFNDRFLGPVDSDLVYASCFGLCSDNVQCTSSADNESAWNALFTLVNNPTGNGLIGLKYNIAQSGIDDLMVVDAMGQLQKVNAIGQEGNVTWLDVTPFHSGIYFLTFTQGQKRQSLKFVKL